MADGKLRVAVVGCGMIANSAHIPAWQSQRGAEVVGVMDTDLGRARVGPFAAAHTGLHG